MHENGSEWIRALPLETCGLFKDWAFCLKKGTKTSIKDLTHPADTNCAQRETHTDGKSKEERLKKKEGGKKALKAHLLLQPSPPTPTFKSAPRQAGHEQ